MKNLVSSSDLFYGPPVNEDVEAFEHGCTVLFAKLFSDLLAGGDFSQHGVTIKISEAQPEEKFLCWEPKSGSLEHGDSILLNHHVLNHSSKGHALVL